MAVESVAFVGVVGGAGTTRSALELAAILARAGRSALLLDLDFATQGLSRFVDERLDPDATQLLADPDVALESAVNDVALETSERASMVEQESLSVQAGGSPAEGQGRLGIVPAFAPFAAVARAKTPAAGARVDDRIQDAAESFDHVLLDVPPVVSNQAVGAVTAADRVVGVIPPTERGLDSLQRERGRVADVDSAVDQVLAVDAEEPLPADVDLAVPALPDSAPAYRPASIHTSGAFTDGLAHVAASLFDVDLADSIDATPSLLGRLGQAADHLS